MAINVFNSATNQTATLAPSTETITTSDLLTQLRGANMNLSLDNVELVDGETSVSYDRADSVIRNGANIVVVPKKSKSGNVMVVTGVPNEAVAQFLASNGMATSSLTAGISVTNGATFDTSRVLSANRQTIADMKDKVSDISGKLESISDLIDELSEQIDDIR